MIHILKFDDFLSKKRIYIKKIENTDYMMKIGPLLVYDKLGSARSNFTYNKAWVTKKHAALNGISFSILATVFCFYVVSRHRGRKAKPQQQNNGA